MESYVLPPLYSRWITELLGASPDGESRTTCGDCPLCKDLNPKTSSDVYFQSSTKCCTYYPTVPNYLAGGILQDDDSAFQNNRSIFEKGALSGIITPMGVEARGDYALLYRFKKFGQVESLVCPFYINTDGGLCGIWQYRNSRCSTWFCKYDRGRSGYEFWKAVDTFLVTTEEFLAKWCVQELEINIPPDPQNSWQAVWGNWEGREREFYERCFDLVRNLSLQDLLNMAIRDINALSENIVRLFEIRQTPGFPDTLWVGEFRSVDLENGSHRLWGYSSYDPIDLPGSIVNALPFFDGSPVLSVLARIQEKTGMRIETGLLQKLHDFRILVSADPKDPSASSEQT